MLYPTNFGTRYYMTNKEIIEKAQEAIIARSDNPSYPMERHLKDMDLIAELTELKVKYA